MHGAFGKFPFLKGLSPFPEKQKTRLDDVEESPWPKVRMDMYALYDETIRAGDIKRYESSNEEFYSKLDARITDYVKKIARTVATAGAYVNAEDVKYCAELIRLTNEDNREQLYAELSASIVTRQKSVEEYSISLMYRFPVKYQAEILKAGLQNPHDYIRKYFALEIKYLPEPYRTEAQEIALKDSDETIHRRALLEPTIRYRERSWEDKNRPSILQYTPSELPKRGSEKYKELQALAEETPLYDFHTDSFGRRRFAKEGSGTTLLDVVPGDEHNPLRGRLIVRHIEITAYDAWKRAYEAHEVWKRLGFDYIPIEPIVSVRFNKSARPIADVFTRVLGVNASDWLASSQNVYARHIIDEVNRIRHGMDMLNIDHGHPHLRNFCLYFKKGKDGKPDLTVPPRVYLIDLDRAEWVPPPTFTVEN